MKAVAAAADVSLASVSNAYNRPERLSAAVRERILRVAEDLGYAGPDPAARTLRAGRAVAIGVLFTAGLSYAFSDPYSVEMLRGLSEEAERSRTSLVLVPLAAHGPAFSDAEVAESVAAVRRAVIDGAIVDGVAEPHAAIEVLHARGVPIVRSVDDPSSPCVFVDDRAAGRMLGAHLAELGHRNVAVLVDAPQGAGGADPQFPYARLRVEGIRAGLGPGAQVTVVVAGPNTAESGRAAGAGLLGARRGPTAIAAVTDVLALGVLAAVRERGLAPGRDVAVSGFDDIPAAAPAGLTTVRQPIAEKGRLMGRMLLDPDFTDRRVVLPLELVPRATSIPRERSER
jgi:DNA-binding LacI/PurR family transcriptional regulator